MKILNRHLITSIIILICSILLFEVTNIDLWIQDYFFNSDLQKWILDRDDPVSRLIFYDGIKKVYYLMFILFLIGLFLSRKIKWLRNYKYGLLIVCFSAVLVPSTIAGLKAITNVPCPKDIQHFGGKYPHVTFLEKYPASFHQTGKIKCYPAGHASGGFSLLSLIFLFKKRKNRKIAFYTAMFLGWSTGVYKMLIGDHFLSHTLTTMLLSWVIILMIAKYIYHFYRINDHYEYNVLPEFPVSYEYFRLLFKNS